jgi:hypothetical protein
MVHHCIKISWGHHPLVDYDIIVHIKCYHSCVMIWSSYGIDHDIIVQIMISNYDITAKVCYHSSARMQAAQERNWTRKQEKHVNIFDLCIKKILKGTTQLKADFSELCRKPHTRVKKRKISYILQLQHEALPGEPIGASGGRDQLTPYGVIHPTSPPGEVLRHVY